MNRRKFVSMTTGAIAAAYTFACFGMPSKKEENMKYRGIVYDVGLKFVKDGPYSVERFDSDLVAYDINTISTKMHANAIRIEGEEIERLVEASKIAQTAGLTIFFNPWKMNVPMTELPEYFAKAAQAAEQLRKAGADLIFVTGCEMSLFNEGIINGDTVINRVKWLANLFQHSSPEDLLVKMSKLLNSTLQQILTAVRNEFKGLVTYSAGTWEIVDWTNFDIVGVDHYRSHETQEEYISALDRYRINKPLIVMEVGSCAYEGAGKLGGGGFMRLQDTTPDGEGIFVDDIVPTRSEKEQADYVEEQINLLNSANISGVFIYVFSFPTYRYGEGKRDLDMMSFSLVKTYPQNNPKSRELPPWEPKEAFHRISEIYKKLTKQ